ncbi:MAG: exo-alpha-sialidase, partial [Paenibacillaceae bacterium]|nr:exo-alpha-sialidase [Paenibacillaceae bacterium]
MQADHPLKVKLLADDYVKIYESPDPDNVYTYSPGIAVLASGRLVATMDMSGPGMDKVAGPKQVIEHGSLWFGKVFVSDDGGRTWAHKTDFPFMHARPFVAGGRLYVLGHCNELMIIRSDDDGETWSEPAMLSAGVGEVWHQAPSNVHYAKGNVYLVMERITVPTIKAHPVSVMAPVMMRAAESFDLTRRESWTFASELVFRDAIDERALDYFGVPFFQAEREASVLIAPPRRRMSPVGWLETNVVQFTDPAHYFHDPTGRTFHLWMRANTGGTGFALVAKVVENEDGTMTTMLEKVPSGRTIAFVPCPG